jgi:BMFP domain-containing protein YqiC
MALLFRCVFLRAGLDYHDCRQTAALKDGPATRPGLERRHSDRHCQDRPRSRRFFQMTQTSNRFFDEIGRLMNDAAGAAQGVKREVDTVVRNQAEKILRDLDIVKREEFEAVKDMARLAREENEALKSRIAALEAKLGGSSGA